MCQKSGIKSISKFFRLVINRLVYQWQCSGCFIGWKVETAPTEQNIEGTRISFARKIFNAPV